MVKPVLEMRWRAPQIPTNRDPANPVEVAYFRFQKDHYRVTVVPIHQHTYLKSELTTLPVPATAYGWGVALNGDLLDGTALSFTDACYAAWAVFVEIVPGLARPLTQAMAWELARSGTADQLRACEVYVEPGHVGDPQPATDTGGAAEAGPDPAAIRPAGGATRQDGAAPQHLDSYAVGGGPEGAGAAVPAGAPAGDRPSREGGYAYRPVTVE